MAENTERAVLAGGCFWILQQLLRQCTGVVSTRVGWMGGEGDNPTEANNGGHAEVVEVVFDPDRLPYRDLLEYFFVVHRPDLGEDVVGTIYRSEIFHLSEAQRLVADETIRDVDASRHWPGKVSTRVSMAGRFVVDPPCNQNYLQRFPRDCPAPFPRRGEQGGAHPVARRLPVSYPREGDGPERSGRLHTSAQSGPVPVSVRSGAYVGRPHFEGHG